MDATGQQLQAVLLITFSRSQPENPSVILSHLGARASPQIHFCCSAKSPITQHAWHLLTWPTASLGKWTDLHCGEDGKRRRQRGRGGEGREFGNVRSRLLLLELDVRAPSSGPQLSLCWCSGLRFRGEVDFAIKSYNASGYEAVVVIRC